MDFMTVEMSAYQKESLVTESVEIQPSTTDQHLNGNVEMSADHMMNTGMQHGGNVQMVHADINQWSAMALYLEPVQKTKFCVDTSPPRCKYLFLLICIFCI